MSGPEDEAAKILGMTKSTLYGKVGQFGLRPWPSPKVSPIGVM